MTEKLRHKNGAIHGEKAQNDKMKMAWPKMDETQIKQRFKMIGSDTLSAKPYVVCVCS